MSTVNIICYLGIVTIASSFILIPNRIAGIIKPLAGFAILLALAQLLMEGYYWQFLPSYLLLCLLMITAFFLKNRQDKIQKKSIQFSIIFLILCSIVPWSIFLPVPKLPKPLGQYRVGTKIFRWIDSNRHEQLTTNPSDYRNVVVQAWYPRPADAIGNHSKYIDGLHNLPNKIGILPRFIFDHFDQVETHGMLNAQISSAQKQWPVIIFLTGNEAARAFYTGIVSGLVSHGFVVLAMDHPYEAMITQLANGEVVTPIEVHSSNDPDLTNFMENRLNTRIADIQYVINKIIHQNESADDFLSKLDTNRIMITGHSLGGATAGAAMAHDPRLKAAANLDGTLYGELPESYGPRPFLLLESKKGDSIRYMRYENGNQKLFKQFGGGFRYEIIEADHYSFTDVPFFLALPTRAIAGKFLNFGNVTKKTQHATIDILNVFFKGAMKNDFSRIDSIGAHYGLIQKQIIK
ncbi:MAG TPA: hypothetical protein PLY70_11490 [Saprospiraceae bacterium]|nr:hypothetical protein [Saprospiraceae bacterium]HPN70611.1 hypothetical protein [Saprospiraceae bacterium]